MIRALDRVTDDSDEPLSPPVDDRLLFRIVKRIVTRLPDVCIVLFGSHACGTAREDSDVDLLLISVAVQDRYPLLGELYGLLSPRRLSLDLVAFTPQELQQRIAGFDPFLEEIVSGGRVLYGRLPKLPDVG